jgi:hypothetical protein
VVGEPAGDLGVGPAVVVGDREAVAERRDQERQDERQEGEPLEPVAPCGAQRTTRTTILSATRATTRPGPRLAPPKLLSSTTA